MKYVELSEPPAPAVRKAPTFYQLIRWVLYGTPISSEEAESTLLRKLVALPVFSSDAISSVAYGTQQILLALCAAGLFLPQFAKEYGGYTLLVSAMIAGLLAIVVISYWQTIFAYPNGGGSYIVSRENLGTLPGLVAAAALLIDYVLTVSVSIASGMQNLKDVPVFASLHIGDHLVLYCIAAIAILTFANLRGLKESGTMFALPTYVFVGMCYLMIGIGLIGPLIGWHFHTEYVNQTMPPTQTAISGAFGIVVLLRAFANGCSAMTGTEAVSNGVPAFKEPKSRNAALTLVFMGLILGSIFMGVSWLAVHFHVVYWEQGGHTAPAVIDQISGAIFGKTGAFSWAYLTTQIFTALILVLAANTSFADFPRLSSILARDRFLPRQLANLGDRLAFNNGIFLLGLFSALLILIKNGSVDLLIPFYAIGVFLAFTLSQTGMVKRWFTIKGKGWQRKAMINGLGATVTFIVLMDILAEKFVDGAWMVVIIIAILIVVFKTVYGHYDDVRHQLDMANYDVKNEPMRNTVLVLIQGLHAGTMHALEYAKSISSDCQAVYVEVEPERTEYLKKVWEQYVSGFPLIVIKSPYRSLIRPIMHYLDSVHDEMPNHRITVVVGEFVPSKWWHSLLHGNTGLILKLALLGRRDIVVANVRYWLEQSDPGKN
jgi:amino acid transporter